MKITVAVAVIVNPLGHILITQRPLHVPHGGQWEFPGGKLKKKESPIEALKREIKEEVGLDVIQAEYLSKIHHFYDLKEVVLFVYRVHVFKGNACCHESQLDMRWVSLLELENFEFPGANRKILDLLWSKNDVSSQQIS